MVKLCFSFLLLSAALVISGCDGMKVPRKTSGQNVSCENHIFNAVVLLAPENATYLEKHFATLWNPSTNIVNEATGKIENYLRHLHPEKSWQVQELAEIRVRLPKTVCQAVGITFEGHEAILLNCLPAEGAFTNFWRDRFIKVFDGGAHYWNVIYIPESGSFVNLKINGMA